MIFLLLPSVAIATVTTGSFSTGYFLSYVVYFIVAILLLNMDYSIKHISQLMRYYAISGVVIGAYILIQRYDFYGGGNERHTLQFGNNLPFDPNFIAAYLVVPTLILFALLIYKFDFKKLVGFFISFSAILFTASRAAMIGVIIGVLIILFDFFLHILFPYFCNNEYSIHLI